ncbi:GNAT family N-acetyltransferase [Paracoccus sp. TK19116]|uniref:GNAT family N-acetyltransferase n=1 Tax=Paracoccus albicereus TaxID=2922394 RepID=A0ABT1MML5_9RHOB|nr:GNAT family N-acetyltransferase [Paracoccus albicereus]MCQ0969525.1 GNAT family N-acetyltransferase [Paracoccus albicereus]
MLTIRLATPSDDDVLVSHYVALWRSYGTADHEFEPDARERTSHFLREGRARHHLKAFIATFDGKIVGSVCCEEPRSPYPIVLRKPVSRVGYVGSMFVEDDARGRGIGKRLLERAIGHLREIGCTQVVLHSSTAGRPLYEGFGFGRTGEMSLSLKPGS